LVLIPALASLALPIASRPAGSSLVDSQAGLPETWQINPQGKPPSDEEIRSRAEKLVANQHQDDLALEQYERVEHHVDRTAGTTPRTLENRVYRVVPTGAGTMKIVLRDGDKPVDPASYNRQLQNLKDILQTMANPNDPKAKAAYAKRAKRDRDRAEFVDAAKMAFAVRWIGTSPCRGRICDVFELDPSPDFHPHGMFQDALTHVTARVWADRETNQMVRGEARVMSDVSFGAGILGKLYRGGVVSMEQAEVTPGIWLPTRYQYDFAGRKFLFAFEQHQTIDASHYRRIGPPKEALLLVQDELANGKSFIADP
jgi:hypothetical protein